MVVNIGKNQFKSFLLHKVSILALSVIAARCQIPPFVAARHLFLSLSPAVTFLPGAGRICPGRGKSFLKGRSFGKEMNRAWTAKGSPFGGAAEQSEAERASLFAEKEQA